MDRDGVSARLAGRLGGSTAGDEAQLCLDPVWRNERWRLLFTHTPNLSRIASLHTIVLTRKRGWPAL